MSYDFLSRARMSVSGTPGTGNITLGSAITGFQSFAAAGASDQDTFSYLVEDGTNWEYGVAVYNASGPYLARAVEGSSSGGSLVSLTSAAVVSCSIRAEDLRVPWVPPIAANLTALQNLGGATLTNRFTGVSGLSLHVKPNTSDSISNIYCAMQAAPGGGGNFSVMARVITSYFGAPADEWEGAGVTIRDGTSGYQFAAWMSSDSAPKLNHTLGTTGGGSFAAGSLDGQQPISFRNLVIHLDYIASTHTINLSISWNALDKILVYSIAGAITNPAYCGICWLGTYLTGLGGAIGGEHDFVHYYAGISGNGF